MKIVILGVAMAGCAIFAYLVARITSPA